MFKLYESGLRISPILQELANKKKSEELHPTAKKSSLVTKCILGLFTILSTVKNDAMHTPLPSTATHYQRLVHRFHEANELFDGT